MNALGDVRLANGAAKAQTFDLSSVCRFAAELSPLALIAAEGPEHIVRFANPAFLRLSGLREENILSLRFCEAVPESKINDCEALLDRVYQRAAAETLTDQEHDSLIPGVYWTYTAWAILDTEKRPAGVMIQVTDTSATQRTRAQATAVNETLQQHGLKDRELSGVLQERERAVEANEALLQSLLTQNELTSALNIHLQRAMQETHHRVKNNLQIVAALAEIQMADGSEFVPVSALERIALHVRSLASLHDVLTMQIRENASGDTVDSALALVKLVALLQTSVGSRRILHQIASIPFTIQKSASLSLLVSELVSNAAKHGAGDITVTLQQEDAAAFLTVSDTGKGFPPDFDSAAGVSTGMELILSLVRHDLGGAVTFANAPNGGASATTIFPV